MKKQSLHHAHCRVRPPNVGQWPKRVMESIENAFHQIECIKYNTELFVPFAGFLYSIILAVSVIS